MAVQVNPFLVGAGGIGGGAGGVGSILGPDASVDGNIPVFEGAQGDEVRDSGVSIYDLTPGANVKLFGAIGDGTSHPLSEFYDSLAAAQAVYPHATSLTNEIDWAAIQKAVNDATLTEIGIPDGKYMINMPIVIARDNIKFRGVSHGNYGDGTVLRRTADIKMITATGISITVQDTPFALISRIIFEGILFDGGDNFSGGDPLNSNAHYLQPLMDLRACYRWAWHNCHFTNCAGSALEARELWDSRIMNVEWTFCGSRDGTKPALNLLSGGSSPGYETCNNLYFFGNRWESSPGVLTAMVGNNGVDFWFHACKWEAVEYQLDYLILMDAATGVRFTDCWVYATGTTYNNLLWTDGSTSNTIGSSGTKNFTITTGLTYNGALQSTQIFAGMHVVMYDSANPDNFMTGRVSSYNSGTGALAVTAEYSEGSGTKTSWKIAPMHPGLVKMKNNCRLITGNFVGGYQFCANAPVDAIFVKTFMEIVDSEVINLHFDAISGTDRLPNATFKAYHDTTTVASVGYGSKSFTIETGKTISVNDVLFIFGRPIANHSDWMVGRVTAYNSGTGALTVQVDRIGFGGVPANSVTGWTMMKAAPQMALQVGVNNSLLSGALNRVRITGGSQGYGFAYGTDASNAPAEYESIRLARHGSPTLYQRDKRTQDDWYMGRIIADPTTVPNPDGLGGTVTGNTGQYQFAVYDFARLTEYVIWRVDGARNLVVNRPLLLSGQDSKVWFIDPDTGSGYRQASIIGAGSTPPAVASFQYYKGDIFLNSNGASGTQPWAWYCTAGGVAGAATWKPLGTIDHDASAIGYTGQKYAAASALTDGASIAWDLDTKQAATLTIGGNRTLANPTNMKNGATYTLLVTQDGTGSRTLGYGSAYKWAGGAAPTLSTAAGAVDLLSFYSDGTNMYGAIVKGFA